MKTALNEHNEWVPVEEMRGIDFVSLTRHPESVNRPKILATRSSRSVGPYIVNISPVTLQYHDDESDSVFRIALRAEDGKTYEMRVSKSFFDAYYKETDKRALRNMYAGATAR